MELALVDKQLKSIGTVEGADALFARAWNGALVHRLATSQAANGREGTRKQKTRSEVKCTTKRLHRQKGTGRARAGMASSPIRRGGGRAFPAHPRDNLRKELNRKEFRAGMATLLSQLVREERLFIAEELAAAEMKTKPCAQMIDAFAAPRRLLFVDTEFDRNFEFSARNLPQVSLRPLHRLLSTDLMRHSRVVLSRRALEAIAGAWTS